MTKFLTIVADPAWKYSDKLSAMKSSGSGAESHYSCMTISEIAGLVENGYDPAFGGHQICGFPIADDAHLWLWVPDPFIVNEPWYEVPRAWGFTPKALTTWVKGRLDAKPHERVAKLTLHVGQGRYTRGCTEHMILCVRGRAADLVQSHSEPNVFIARRTKHSQKPEESYALVERVSPGPYLELFARRRREGWTSWGNEV